MNNIYFKVILTTTAIFSGIFSGAQHYSLTWKNFNVKDDTRLEILGTLDARPSDGTGNSYWSVGCETLDRDMAVFSEYKDYVGQLGVGYARIQSGWAKCEKEEGVYDFAWLDEIVDGLLGQGVKPWMCLCYGNPVYNSEGADLGSAIFTSKTAMNAWCRYVEQVVRRYKGKVTMYEVWNEPNLGNNKAYPERYAELFTNTARTIRKIDKDVYIAGMSLSGSLPLDYPEKVFEILKKKGTAELMQFVTFHPYWPNPDDASATILKLRELAKSYNPDAEILQGETGCPAILEWGHALSYREWTEYSQVKWVLRRMANDFRMEIPSSIFTMVDLQYKNMLQSFGLIRMNLLKQPVYKRPTFYAVQHMANVFTTDMKPFMEGLEISCRTDHEINFTGIKKDGRCVGVMMWFCENIPSDSISKEKLNVTVNGLTLEHPVLLDPLTGRVYSLKDVVIRGGNTLGRMKFTGLPMWDSPLIIIEKDALRFSASDSEAVANDGKTQETFI